MMPSRQCGDIESNGQGQNDGKASHSTTGYRWVSSVDWDGYSKSGNKAATAWLIFLFVVLGLAIQQASSTIVSQQTAIRSALEDTSFASPDQVISESLLRRKMMDVSEESTGTNSSPSLEMAGKKSENSSGP